MKAPPEGPAGFAVRDPPEEPAVELNDPHPPACPSFPSLLIGVYPCSSVAKVFILDSPLFHVIFSCHSCHSCHSWFNSFGRAQRYGGGTFASSPGQGPSGVSGSPVLGHWAARAVRLIWSGGGTGCHLPHFGQ